MVMAHVGAVGHLLLGAVVGVVEVKHVADVAEETRGGRLTRDVTGRRRHCQFSVQSERCQQFNGRSCLDMEVNIIETSFCENNYVH